ncbi:MAG: bifunctional UDP-N-acetylglucosamine diphosphorylase/glucosamine-1-phosphate N-acetyltransferase GlmU [Gammaproteobacteria bacterium]|nr:bifunctional UDP-N-acetylglucosamine diphosphorylase/glucosamine-1-phosphate N-acetyltransferase GlmU [Gammaproteobacteria bacterium]
MSNKLEAIILAAGSGSRMYSDLPKVLQPLAGRPLLHHVLTTARQLGPAKIHVVIGHQGDKVRESCGDFKEINWVLQEQQLGTGHAVKQALPHCASDCQLLILYGDVPLTSVATLSKLIHLDAAVGLLTVDLDNPDGYGRITRGENGHVQGIVEHKDATRQQREIREISTGIMTLQCRLIQPLLNSLSDDNAQGEYYLTDIVSMAVAEGVIPETVQPTNPIEVQGVNDQSQLNKLERSYQRDLAEGLMKQGTRIMDPARFDLRGTLTAGKDVVIDINALFEGEVVLGDGVMIGANCCIQDTVIGDRTVVHPNSIIDGARIGAQCMIGPFARIRPGTVLDSDVRVGNFVETKNATIGKGSKASHLTYLGDTEVGQEANIGAGTITCNYDGVNKHKTYIGNGAFIGSNVALVAPVEINDNAHIGAGSTITKSVPENALAIGRGRQRNIPDWKKKD